MPGVTYIATHVRSAIATAILINVDFVLELC